MPNIISETGTKKKQFYSQFSVALTPLERMFIGYYAARYGKDQVAILRGMLHKFVEHDANFEVEGFIKWAERVAIPEESNRDMRSILKEQLRDFQSAHGEEVEAAEVDDKATRSRRKSAAPAA